MMKSRTVETREVWYQTKHGELIGKAARSALCEFWIVIDMRLYVYRVEKFRLVQAMIVNECISAGWEEPGAAAR